MSFPIEDKGMTSNPGKGVGDGVSVGTPEVGVGEEVDKAGGVTV